ncbi:MAG: hypothetical protein ABFD46_01550 [Armatimonadota bacterium]
MESPEQQDLNEFSLSTGGLLHSLSQHTKVADHIIARVFALMVITWFPLLILWEVYSPAAVDISFLLDYGVYGRILVAIPLLVIAEIPINRRTRDALGQFIKTNLTRAEDVPLLASAVRDATAQKGSILAEIIILAIIYSSIGVRSMVILPVSLSTWYYADGKITPAGWYYLLVSLPAFQFLLIRWIWRLAIWTGLLWRISRLDLQLVPIHPDKMGGLGFLGLAQIPFGIIGFACGAVISTSLLNHITYRGLVLANATSVMVVYVVLAVLVIIAPVFVFTGKLVALRASGILKYGDLGEDYARLFDQKWIGGSHPEDETVLGSSDIQSLADLANSYAIVQNMRIMAADNKTVIGIAVMAAIPMIPVFFATLPFDEIVARVLGILG